ncbi:MAG: hypothetical protein FJ096_05570 [Deltaproteobacteria bacterium]|nr:hypothetical protein [Deltaproteobacteria bacterium]
MRTSGHGIHVLGIVALVSGACGIEGPPPGFNSEDLADDGVAPTTGGPSTTSGGPCIGPLGEPTEPDALPSCGPEAHCIASVTSWPELAIFAGACASGGYCVPDALIQNGGIFTPKSCASIGGASGACLSTVFPEIDKNKAFMPQDVCATDERCVPCVSPLDQTETGACALKFACPDAPSGTTGSAGSGTSGAGGAAPGSGDDPSTCEYDGAPILDPSALPACPKSVCGSGGALRAERTGSARDGGAACGLRRQLVLRAGSVPHCRRRYDQGQDVRLDRRQRGALHVDVPRRGRQAGWLPPEGALGRLCRGRSLPPLLRPPHWKADRRMHEPALRQGADQAAEDVPEVLRRHRHLHPPRADSPQD